MNLSSRLCVLLGKARLMWSGGNRSTRTILHESPRASQEWQPERHSRWALAVIGVCICIGVLLVRGGNRRETTLDTETQRDEREREPESG